MAHPFFTALVLLYLSGAISALSLTTFQAINGFSAACTNAYNTELTDCSTSDFSGKGCSTKCIGFLDDLTETLARDCAGTSSYPNTLIGMFFNGTGVQILCPNAGESSSSGGSGYGGGQNGGQNNSPAIQSVATEASTTTISTSTTTTSTTSTSTSSTTSVSSTPQAAATSSSTTIVPTTVSPEATTTSVAIVGTTVSPETTSDASTSTSHTRSSTSSSGTSTSTSDGNGGGTPLDIESSACHDAAMSVWLFALLATSAGVVWLL